MSQRVRVLVTGVSGGSIGEQVLKALSLGRRNYDIVAANAAGAPLFPGAWRSAELPLAGDSGYIDAVLDLSRRHEVCFVAPGSEPELIALAPERERLEAAGVHLLANDLEVVRAGVNKALTMEVLERAGARSPRSWECTSLDELATITIPAPWIVKPMRGGGGSANTYIAQDSDELRCFTSYVIRAGGGALVQEYVGRMDLEFTVGVLHLPDGQLAGSVALRRQISDGLSNRVRVLNRTGRPELGAVLAVSSGISQGEIADFADVRAQAERIAFAMGSIGPLNVQGRLVDGQLVVFELNPRFSGTSPMRAMAGFNEPELLIDWYLGERSGRVVRPTAFGTFTRGLVEFFTPAEQGTV